MINPIFIENEHVCNEDTPLIVKYDGGRLPLLCSDYYIVGWCDTQTDMESPPTLRELRERGR